MAFDEADLVEFPPIIGTPGARGAKGDTGATGATGASGKSAYTATTAQFLMPASSATVTIAVTDTSWMAIGGAIYIVSAGYFTVTAIASSTSATVRNTGLSGNATPGDTIAAQVKVAPGGYAYVDTSSFSNFEGRLQALESASSPGNHTFYSATEPAGDDLIEGDLWFDTNDNYKLYRWDGSGWASATKVLEAGDFGSGLRPVKYVAALPSVGNQEGDFAFLTTDKKLYRYVNDAWTKALEGEDLIGEIDGGLIATNSIVAGSLQAGLILTDKLSTEDLLVTNSAQVAEATIVSAHIVGLDAGKIDVGDLKVGVRMNAVNRLYNTDGAYEFRSVEIVSTSGDAFNFGEGTAFTFNHPSAARLIGPNVAPSAGAARFNPDGDGVVRVALYGSLIGYTGNVCVYYRKNNTGTYTSLAAVNSDDGGNAVIQAFRGTGILTGITVNDTLDFRIAPCDGYGDTSSDVTCRYELDVVAFNW